MLLLPLVAPIALAGCAPNAPPIEQGARPKALKEAVAAAAQQVRRCYRAPRVASAARSIVTTLRVRYAPDGTVIGLPTLLSQAGVTPSTQVYAGRMAEAATLAVMRCAPIALPGDLHADGWSEIDLTFSPYALG